ncbi:MAG: response regulator transcription factor [Burkholderiaceae bacterium]|nr:response regulator transcription factor [Burkholderiaceae bacterium]
MKAFNILLVDDHALVRAGIKSLIDQIDGFVVTDEASNVDEAMCKVSEAPLPDIVITDISMGSGNGLDLVGKLKQLAPDIKVMILSMHTSEALVSEALKLGVSAYLPKEAVPAELPVALYAVACGETFLSPAVSTKIIDRFVRPSDAVADPLKSLTARQIQILTLLANGRGTKEIAYELDLSDKTVAAHRTQIMERLGIHDLVGLVLFAVKHGLVSVEKP